MIQLSINNSMCQVTGLDATHFKALRQELSYKIDPHAAYHSGSARSPVRYLLGVRGDYPTGLDYLVRAYLAKYKLQVTVVDHRKHPEARQEALELSLAFTPYPEQLDAVAAASKAGRGIVCMPTGVGKSLTMALLINSLQAKTLVVVPNLTLKYQLIQTLNQLFGETDNIVVENIGSSRLKTLTDFDCIIIDEAHHVAAATYRKLNRTSWTKIYYRFFFTATPFRAREEEQLLMESIAGQVIYRLDYPTAVLNRYIVPVEAYYIEMPKREVDGYTWAQVYKEMVVEHQNRNEKIAIIMKRLFEAGKTTLCLVKEIWHGDQLQSLTGAGFANGVSEDCSDLISWFSDGKLKGLIGTTGVVGEGVDTRACEYVIIAGLGKSKNAFMQQVGRGVRKFGDKESAKIIIIKDSSHKWTLAHFRAQCKILKEEYGIIPRRLEV